MSEHTVITCDQCWKEGDEFTVPLRFESRTTSTSEPPLEADFCSYRCLGRWAIGKENEKAAAK